MVNESPMRQPWLTSRSRVSCSLMSVASSSVSPAYLGASMNLRNSKVLLQRYFSPRQTMSLRLLVFQLAMEGKTASAGGGGAGGQPAVAVEGDGEGGGADAFAEGEEGTVLAEVGDGVGVAVVDLDLLHAGVALEVDEVLAVEEVLVDFLGAADVEDGVGGADQLAHL